MNWWILVQSGFIGSFDRPWSEWSPINGRDPDHLKQMHPDCYGVLGHWDITAKYESTEIYAI